MLSKLPAAILYTPPLIKKSSPLSEEIINFYTQFAKFYDEVVLRDKDYTAFEKIPKWLFKAIDKKPAKILDLGCGTGLSAKIFIEKGDAVTGIDITPAMIERCKALHFEELFCQSLEAPLPSQNRQFDAAIMLGVMEFIQKPAALFQEVARVLKEKGLFGITVPKKLSRSLEEKLGILTWNLFEIEPLFKKAGFHILHSESFQGFIHEGEIVPYQGYLLQLL